MAFKKVFSLLLAAAVLGACFAGCSQKQETVELTQPVSIIGDADDSDTSVVSDKEKSNIIELKDENSNTLSLIPINDVANEIMICGYVKSAKDKNGKAVTDKELIDKVIAVTADTSSGTPVYSVTLKDGKKVFLDFFVNDKKQIVAVESATDGKYYEVVTENGDNGNVYMHLKADKDGNPVEVIIKEDKSTGKTKIVEKSTNKTVSEDAEKEVPINTNPKGSSSTASGANSSFGSNSASSNSSSSSNSNKNKDNEETSNDKVIGFADYSELADITVVLQKNSTAAVGLESNSPVKADVKKKAYVSDGVLYLEGNGDYYITSENSNNTWYGKIVVTLGNKGLARVRLAGVNISSSDSKAIEFIDKDTVINDTDVDGEVLVYENTASTKNNPDAVLSFVDGTNNVLSASGNSNGGSGTIYSECKLSIKGHGSGEITSKNKNGIQAERSLGIKNVTLNITSVAGKGIRSKGTIDIEEGANITVNSMGDAVRCNEFLMDTSAKDASGNKDLSTGSTVNLYAKSSGAATATSGDGIDADDSVIVRAGTLNIDDYCDAKQKYGIKVRRVNNEEFLKVIKQEKITSIDDFLKDHEDSVYYADVFLNQKEYQSLLAYKDKSSTSADYQGIRTSEGCDDTLRFTGGTTKVVVKFGRNTTVKDSKNSQSTISAYATGKVRTIQIGSFLDSGDEKISALIYSSPQVDNGKSYSVSFGKLPGKKAVTKSAEFSGNIAYVTDAS